MKTKQFPNGFASWQRAHFEAVKHLIETYQFRGTMAKHIFDLRGTPGLAAMSEQLADDFQKVKSEEGNFYEVFELFMLNEEQNYLFIHNLKLPKHG